MNFPEISGSEIDLGVLLCLEFIYNLVEDSYDVNLSPYATRPDKVHFLKPWRQELTFSYKLASFIRINFHAM